MTDRAVLSVESLDVRFGRSSALTGIELSLHQSESLAIIGPNGSGKSTLVRVLSGLTAPNAGNVIGDTSNVAVVFQSTDVDRGVPLTVLETVRMGRYPHRGLFGRFDAQDRAVVDESLERMDIADLVSAQIHELSGGQRQRVFVAQGLAQQAPVLLLDEPVNGLDLASRQLIIDAIQHETTRGTSVVMTTHDLEDARTCDRVMLLDTSVIALGTPSSVITEANLRAAFGGKVLRLPSGELLMDDPHHHHDH